MGGDVSERLIEIRDGRGILIGFAERSDIVAVVLEALADVASDAARTTPDDATEARLALDRLACFAANWKAKRPPHIALSPEQIHSIAEGEIPGGWEEYDDAPDPEKVREYVNAAADTILAEPVRELVDFIYAHKKFGDEPYFWFVEWSTGLAYRVQIVRDLLPPRKADTGTVSTEAPDTAEQADAGEDGPVKGASTEPCDIPAESGESEVREALRKFDQAHTPWVVKALTRGWITEEGKEAWNRDVAPHMFRLYAFLPDKAPESEASAGSGDVCPDTTEATFSATRDGAKLTLGASGTFEEEPFCGPGSFEPAAPYGTVDAHLAEQMKDPEFRAEYLRGAARVAAEDGETVLRKLKRDVDAMAKILPSVLELLERAI
ncbi:MAG TPA: hypothetical protein VM537_05740 [Anaerolineae bacterium]|nr:hypothetical protein [Anaerolineae bacterium]